MPIFIPDLFTSYINGRRQAVADNWQDLSNYNQIAAGQLNNAFNMATFDPRVRIAESQAQLGEQNAALGGATTDQALRHIAAQDKLNIPDLSASTQATGFKSQQALYNHTIKMLTDPDYARTYYALGLGLGMPQYQFMQQPNNTSSTGGTSGQTSTGGTSGQASTGGTSGQTPTGVPYLNTGK